MSLVLSPPPGQGIVLKYKYKVGKLLKTTKMNGQVVPRDPNGIPT